MGPDADPLGAHQGTALHRDGQHPERHQEQDRPHDLTSYANYFIGLLDGNWRPQQLAEAQAVAAQMHAEYDALFAQGYRAFLCPTLATAAVEADFDLRPTS